MQDPPPEKQAAYWDRWNEQREHKLNRAQERQWDVVRGWVSGLGRRNLRILDVGCGAGWLSGRLREFGEVTGIDFTANIMARARQKYPDVRFICDNFATVDLPDGSFDLIVHLEVLAHVPDQHAFMEKCKRLLSPGGVMVMSIQNRLIYSRMDVAPPSPDQIRKWLSPGELKRLVSRSFTVEQTTSVCPEGYKGYLRIVNSPKICAILSSIFSPRRVERSKERLMLGRTQLMLARRGRG